MKRVNKFYLFMSLLVLVLGLIMIYSVRSVINSFMIAGQTERGERLVTVDSVQLEEVYDWALDRENTKLLITDEESSDQVIQQEEDEEIEE